MEQVSLRSNWKWAERLIHYGCKKHPPRISRKGGEAASLGLEAPGRGLRRRRTVENPGSEKFNTHTGHLSPGSDTASALGWSWGLVGQEGRGSLGCRLEGVCAPVLRDSRDHSPAGGNVNGCSHFGKPYGGSSKN